MDQKVMLELEKIAKEACHKNNVALYDFEYKATTKGMLVLVYITKITGVSVEDCKKVSRHMERILEEDDIINNRYYLEVSSPGLERDLKLKKHYVSAIGEKVKIVVNDAESSSVVTGILKEVLPAEIVVEDKAEERNIKFSEIKKARTYFDYKKSD